MPPIRTNQTPDFFPMPVENDEDTEIPCPNTPTPNEYLLRSLSPLTDEGDETQPRPLSLPAHKSHQARDSVKLPKRTTRGRAASQSQKDSNSKVKLPSKPIIVGGYALRPTIVFDTFWRWCAERLAINERRCAGQKFPWTDDPILRVQFFCNAYRVLDKTSQYIIREVIQKGDQTPNEIVFRVILFDIFTKIETWEYLNSELGPLTWKGFRIEDYIRVLEERAESGEKLYTSAFQKPAPRWQYRESFKNHILLLEHFMTEGLTEKLQRCRSMSDAFAFIAAFPGMGPFNSWQLLVNISYSSVLNFSGKDFVMPGPGAISGLAKLFGSSIENVAKKNSSFRLEVMRYMMETQNEHFQRLNLPFSGLGPDHLPMYLVDIEHALCEVDKYARMAHPGIKGTNGCKESKRGRYTPSTALYLPTPTLPVAWSHKKRMVVRPCRKIPKINKRFTVASILGHGIDDEGVLKCKIRWVNYGPEDDTWEPISVLLEDTPASVDEYWKRTYGCKYPRK